ncbi:unnamed protein product [Clonostachys rhizophaga]|uniref:Uncharacterized protein n=1 Tax=Clonostachys rhizophaga TaxID=160324 RepID=A0A9N9YIE0_9HYPO|nr:unnamed protein product [Clonostachys rhizophaga]
MPSESATTPEKASHSTQRTSKSLQSLFVTGYLGIPIFLVLIFGYKIIYKTKGYKPEEVDLFSGKDIIDREEEEFLARKAASKAAQANEVKSNGRWFYRHFIAWLL